LTPQIVAQAVRESDMLGKDIVLERLDQLYSQYVANIDEPGAQDDLKFG
jgi:hypothetical protein